MAGVYYQKNEIGFKFTGLSVNVPNNDVARLMYYLNCVLNAIEMEQDSDVRRFINYANWSYLSLDEQKVLVTLCCKFSPDVLENKVFFENADLCRNNSNEFIEISQVRQEFLAAESIVIAGQTREVNKIMVYKSEWMNTYYWYPIRGLLQKFRSFDRPAITQSTSSTPSPTSSYRSTPIVHRSSNKNYCCCCDKACAMGTIGAVLFVLAFVLAFVIYYYVKK